MHLRHALIEELLRFGFDVVIGKCTVPCPVINFAGRAGAVPLGGGAQLSAPFSCRSADGWKGEGEKQGRIFMGDVSSWSRNQVGQLIGPVIRAFHLRHQTAIAADDGGGGVVADGAFIGPVNFAEGGG